MKLVLGKKILDIIHQIAKLLKSEGLAGPWPLICYMEKHQSQKRVQKVKDNIYKIQRITNLKEGIMQSLHRGDMTGRIFNIKFIKAV